MESTTQINGITVLPCPSCGGEPRLMGQHFTDDSHIYWVGCKRCGIEGPHMHDGEHSIVAWNGMAVERTCKHGTLTAEQVLEAWTGNLKRDCLYDPPMPDWQAIADELNATLGSGTCEFSPTTDNLPTCSNCGWQADAYDCDWLDGGAYVYDGRFCKHCGAKVVER